ncbi:hypothetical protein [Streptomyces sp. KL116D]
MEPLDALGSVSGSGVACSARGRDPVHVAGPAEYLTHCVLPTVAPLVE